MHRGLVSIIVGILLFSGVAMAAKPEVYSPTFGDAIRGYDPVAYFTEGKPVKGSDEFSYDYKGTTWLFASAENKRAFEEKPEKYAPQYGGYCAWAVSQGYTASIDPDAWTIVDGRLYLNYSKSVQETWSQDVTGNIRKADANWPKVLE